MLQGEIFVFSSLKFWSNLQNILVFNWVLLWFIKLNSSKHHTNQLLSLEIEVD